MIAAAFLLAQAAGTLQLSDRQEVRARITEGVGGQPAQIAMDVVNTPLARAQVSDRRWDYTAMYSPLFTLTAPQIAGGTPVFPPQILHTAGIGVAWHDRSVRLSLTEDGTIGRQNATLLPTQAAAAAPGLGGTTTTQPTTPPTTPGLQAITPITLTLGSSRTTLMAFDRLSRRWDTILMASFLISGGLDHDSQQTLPVQHGPRFEGYLNYALTRVDTLSTHGLAQATDFEATSCQNLGGVAGDNSCAPRVDIALLTESWRHRLTRTSELSIGAGASAVRAKVRPTDPWTTNAFPAAEASYVYLTDIDAQRTVVRIDSTLAPFVDARTGAADYRVQGAATLTFPIRVITVRYILGATRSIDPGAASPFTFIRSDLDIEYNVTRHVGVGGGLRYAWQQQDLAAGTHTPALSTGAIVGFVTVRSPSYKF